jgi:hypothetical protein
MDYAKGRDHGEAASDDFFSTLPRGKLRRLAGSGIPWGAASASSSARGGGAAAEEGACGQASSSQALTGASESRRPKRKQERRRAPAKSGCLHTHLMGRLTSNVNMMSNEKRINSDDKQ